MTHAEPGKMSPEEERKARERRYQRAIEGWLASRIRARARAWHGELGRVALRRVGRGVPKLAYRPSRMDLPGSLRPWPKPYGCASNVPVRWRMPATATLDRRAPSGRRLT